MTLTLSPEIEKALTAAEALQGTTPEQIVTKMVQERFVLPPDAASGAAEGEPTLAELFAGRTGLVNSEGKYNYSSRTGTAYTESLTKQKEQAAEIRESGA